MPETAQTMMFNSPEAARNHEADGFAVLEMGELDVTGELAHIFDDHCGPLAQDGFYYSLMSGPEANIRLKERLARVMRPLYDQWFQSAVNAAESFLMKGAEDRTEMELHQDWCYLDEQAFSPVTLWVPLQDVTPHNGCMFFLPGSHRAYAGLRSGSYPTSRITGLGELVNSVRAVPLRRGQALAFHPGVFHGSYPNLGGSPRRVMGAMLRPVYAPMRYFHRKDDVTASVYEISERTLLSELHPLHLGEPPAEGMLIGTRPYVHQPVDIASLLQFTA
jgi:hypothetical protein